MIENGRDDGTEDLEDEVEMIQNQPSVEQPTKNKQSQITNFSPENRLNKVDHS